MHFLKKAILATTTMILSCGVTAAPFGLEQGMTLDELNVTPSPFAAGKYVLTDVPKPNPAFDQYIVQIGPQTGLCWIKAISKDVVTNPYGYQLKTSFDKMEGIVERIYGDHLTIDRLVHGSRWDSPFEWMAGLLHEERLLAAFWDRGNGSNLPSELVSIDLVASPVDIDKGYIAIEYSFTNEATCDAEWLATAEDVGP